MTDKPLQIPAYLEGYKSTMTKGVKLSFSTNENIDPELLSRILSLQNKLGWLFFGIETIEAEDLINLPKIDKSKYPDAKTPSERLRSVIFIYHKKLCEEKGIIDQNEINKTFQVFYDGMMEKFIGWIKEKL